MARRRLLAVAPVGEPGGAETSMLRLLRELAARGWAVTVTAPRSGRVLDAAVVAGHAGRVLDAGGMGRHAGAAAVRSWPRARRLAREADVVLLNGTVCGRLLPALRGLPARTVLSVHDVVDRVPRMWRAADVVLAASRATADALRPLDAHVVYAPVDLDPPPADAPWERGGVRDDAPGGRAPRADDAPGGRAPRADDAPGGRAPRAGDGPGGRAPRADGPVVGFLGRIEPRKAPLDLVRAAPAIRAGVPGARIVLVGGDPFEGDEDYVAEVERAARGAGVERHPFAPNGPGLMRHLDVLVLPSRQEPFGTVLAEAMAVGTPVVATRVGGLAEVVEDGVTGRLVAPGDPDALAAAVLDVLARRAEMSGPARESARRFSTETYADRFEALVGAGR